MKKISLAAFAVAALATQVASAAAGDMYVGIKGGYKLYSDKTLVDLYKGTAGNNNAIVMGTTPEVKDYKLKGMSSGAFITPELGYMISDEFRSALQFSYNFDQKKVFDAADDKSAVTAKPELKLSGSWDVSGAFYYDFLNSSQFVPFIGVKIGFASRTYQTIAAAIGEGINGKTVEVNIDSSKQTKKGILFGGTLGVAYKVNDKVSLELAYTMERQPKVETVTKAVATANNYAPAFKAPKTSHNIGAGVRFAF
jgi:opacity protein-like surface antigen